MKTALVLGGGGMFGAYQAGAWQVLSRRWQPDLVVGASIGALNGWAIASGIDAEEWAATWLKPGDAARQRLRWPRAWWDGIMDPEPFEQYVRALTLRAQPRTGYAVVVTEWPRLRKRIHLWPEAGWPHVLASCALPGLLPQYRLGGRRLSDGGLLGALPLWAAAQLGATAIVGIGLLGRGGDWRGGRPAGIRDFVLEHPARLGAFRDMFVWSRQNAACWLALGREDAQASLENISRVLCFEAQ
jgi:NTE family protein